MSVQAQTPQLASSGNSSTTLGDTSSDTDEEHVPRWTETDEDPEICLIEQPPPMLLGPMICPTKERIMLGEKLDYFDSVQVFLKYKKANQIHGTLVPIVRYEETIGLPVYATEEPKGIPCDELLCKHNVPYYKLKRTVQDLAAAMCRGVTMPAPDSMPYEIQSFLASLEEKVDEMRIRSEVVKARLRRSIYRVVNDPETFCRLPLVFAHRDLSPCSFYVDPETGRITGILGWEGASYQRIGTDFHFVEWIISNFEERTGWKDGPYAGRLAKVFRQRVMNILTAKGFTSDDLEALNDAVAIGMITHVANQFIIDGDCSFAEKHLYGYLRHLPILPISW